MNCFPSHSSVRRPRRLSALAAAWLLALGLSGCHQRAYNELYIENMASEIRLLEDRVYEYDAEYRALENELQDLQAINQQLEMRLRDADQARTMPRASSPSNAASSRVAPPKEPLRIPAQDAVQLEVETPEPPARIQPPASDKSDVLPPKSNAKPIEPTPAIKPEPEPILPVIPKSPTSSSTAPRGLPSGAVQAGYQDRRIGAPAVEFAMAQNAKSSDSKTESHAREIDFHPTLCRGIHDDGQRTDEGIALVLVPRDSAGGFVPARGEVTVVMEETTDQGARRLGRWTFAPEEIAERIEPVGSGQGIHLDLRWQEAEPQTQSVQVFVRFTDDRGITMVNSRPIHLRKPAPGQSTWTPRGK